ncbi:hypothetical protein SAMN05660860_00519 [Geoalkalibacter ferrihydriticus]|uniref:Cytochrome c domain-containing protein n=1 Tax=Geoalkalibacter ferrihydriticus TaxID=392333 RepID=A0A1G9JP90_9BACT|nr:hypothetical protein [Geoalkalibacter ferrihydriticus]SDL39271.1 hypothetical protein SAMN05660860_00519 [Geoalkalibacter ferrihydriticus]
MLRKLIGGALALLVLGGLLFYTFRYQWPGEGQPGLTMADGDPRQGRQAILTYGCASCHVIPNVRQATGRVGPKLEDIGRQIYLAGVLPNSPDNMIAWIMNPREISPRTAMPDLDVSAQDARDMAAHLYGQRPGRKKDHGHADARENGVHHSRQP